MFANENVVTFYNEDGEQVTISRDWAAASANA